MIPILYEAGETAFTSNGLGRLRDCISCVVTEERNGIYECDFEYPIDGVNYDRIKCGRIILVEHDETNDTQPFDIVGYSRPINGVVTFHAVHISYRQCALTVAGNTDWNNVNTLADALNWLTTADPENPFAYWTDKSSSTGYLLASNGIPYSVRSVLGGMEGSILDVYGGEYEWDRWTVRLWDARGSIKNFSIRYGVNLTNYEEEMDYSDTYTSVVPYWTGTDDNGDDIVVKGDMQTASYPSFNGTGRCVPLDLTDKYETKPTKATLETAGLAYINANQTYLPAQSIKVDFVKLSDSDEYAQFANLQKCKLCDTITVVFPKYDMQGTFKIVKTEYNVLREKYDSLELGTLATSLAEALGINQESAERMKADSLFPIQTSGNWEYITIGNLFIGAISYTGTLAITTQVGQVYQTASSSTINYPVTMAGVQYANVNIVSSSYSVWTAVYSSNTTSLQYRALSTASRSSSSYRIKAFVIGTIA